MRHVRHTNFPLEIGHGEETAIADAGIVVVTTAYEPRRAGARVRVAAQHFALRGDVTAVARAAAVALYDGWADVAAALSHRNQKEKRQEEEDHCSYGYEKHQDFLKTCHETAVPVTCLGPMP